MAKPQKPDELVIERHPRNFVLTMHLPCSLSPSGQDRVTKYLGQTYHQHLRLWNFTSDTILRLTSRPNVTDYEMVTEYAKRVQALLHGEDI